MHSRVQPLREAARSADQRSVSQVLADVVRNLQDILSAEIRLAQAEAREQFRSFRPAAIRIMVGILAGLLCAFFLLMAAVAALSLIMTVWLAALLVALGMAAVCALTLRAGANLAQRRTAKIAKSAKENAPCTAPPTA